MTEVLSYHDKPDGQTYYATSPLKRSSHSYSSLLSHSVSKCNRSRPSPPSPTPSNGQLFSANALPRQSPSYHSSYSDLLHRPSDPPTPASSVFSDGKDEEEEDELEAGEEMEEHDGNDIMFSSYDGGVQFYHQEEALDLPSSPSEESDGESVTQDEADDDDPTPSDSPLLTPNVADDTAVRPNPSRHVDYLSHDWREEDIWASWRHIVSMRKRYGQKSRLENASWRTWAKSKYKLPTVSPETLNWLKESDVTWLYGPLQPAQSHPITQSSPPPSSSQLPCQTLLPTKKPILKKRSVSGVMLQKSLSANSLIRQAAASVQAQQKMLAKSQFVQAAAQIKSQHDSNDTSRPLSRDQLGSFSSLSTSSDTTPSDGPKRHIRFDEKVEQCIAVECQHHFDDDDDDEEEYDRFNSSDSDSSDEGVLTIRGPSRRRPPPSKRAHSASQMPSTKIIEKLPDTTLKNKVDPPDTSGPSTQSPFMQGWISSKLNQSPSQETLRPSNPSRNFLLPNNNDFNDAESKAASPIRQAGDSEHDSPPHSPEPGSSKMRRTPSGMFMPYDEDDEEETAMQLGLFGRVSETINTAKDIAHVIWNVGWRK